MAQHFRKPERRQVILLPADMMDWLPEGDIVHLIVDAVVMMDLGEFETGYKLGRAGQAPFAPQVMLALLIYAYLAERFSELPELWLALLNGLTSQTDR